MRKNNGKSAIVWYFIFKAPAVLPAVATAQLPYVLLSLSRVCLGLVWVTLPSVWLHGPVRSINARNFF